jgi:hypothetical protein
MKNATLYQQDLIESLKDPHEAAAYLSAAFEDGDRNVILLALQNVAEARGTRKNVPHIPSLFSLKNDTELPQRKSTPFSTSFQESIGKYPTNDSSLRDLTVFLQSMGLKLRVEPMDGNFL